MEGRQSKGHHSRETYGFINMTDRAGDAIDFNVRRFYHKDYPEAVSYLLDGCNGTLSVSPPIERKPSKPFELPPRNGNMRRVYAYRCRSEGLTVT